MKAFAKLPANRAGLCVLVFGHFSRAREYVSDIGPVLFSTRRVVRPVCVASLRSKEGYRPIWKIRHGHVDDPRTLTFQLPQCFFN